MKLEIECDLNGFCIISDSYKLKSAINNFHNEIKKLSEGIFHYKITVDPLVHRVMSTYIDTLD